MPLTLGARLGPYEIVAPLGEGGMGEVYRARDTRLGRDVAIKVLPASLAGDAERLARFGREARLLAAMTHPGIAAIYGLEDAGGTPALVMELAEGPTLAERIARGPIPADEALAIARSLAEALEYAHERGIVHRDLKPANVKVQPEGSVKVLDFGLARALESDAPARDASLTQSPTITQRMTVAGVILGTAAYMAPEQARGREADRRADIWAFGAIVYEMLTGRRPFGGETISDTLASVMRDSPDWSALPAGLAAGWRRLVGRCLEKDVRARLQAIGEARIALDEIAAGRGEAPAVAAAVAAASPVRRLASALPWAIAAAVAIVAIALSQRRAVEPAAREVSVTIPPGRRLNPDIAYGFMALSPDGRSLAYAASQSAHILLHVRRLDRREEIEIPGSEHARNPFFSPDGQWICFFNSLNLLKVSVRGGEPVALAETGQDRSGVWLDDGTIVYSPETTSPLYRVSAAGGTPVAVTRLDSTRKERSHRWPCALGGGPWVAFTVGRQDSPGGYDDADIDAVNVRTGERRHLIRGGRFAAWAPSGHLVFDRAGSLYALPMDPRNPRATAEPVPVLDGVGGESSSGAAFLSIARDGTLAWVAASAAEKDREIGWYDRAGRWTPTSLPRAESRHVALSPDGTRAIVTIGPGGGAADLWLADLRGSGLTRLTYDGLSNQVVWLPNGTWFVYSRGDSAGGETVVARPVDGTEGARTLYHAPNPVFVSGPTPDGRAVLFSDYGQPRSRIHVAPVAGGPVRALAPDEGNDKAEQAGVLSPDGQWLAYVSTRTRREEVCVRRFDGSGGRWQITNGGGGGVRWGREGRELFFVAGETLMRVSVTPGPTGVVIGEAQPLFDLPATPTEPTWRDYAYDPRTDRFLMTRPAAGSDEHREIELSLGWSQRLAAMLEAKREAK